MNFDYRFRPVERPRDKNLLYRFLNLQEFVKPYPNYRVWIGRAMDEINSGYKRAILAFNFDNVIADAIIQPHKDFPKNILEWKNMVVAPPEKVRGVATFIEGKIVQIAREEGFDIIVCDTRRNSEIEKFLARRAYQKLIVASLYDHNVEDIVYAKSLTKEGGLFTPLKNKILSRAAG